MRVAVVLHVRHAGVVEAAARELVEDAQLIEGLSTPAKVVVESEGHAVLRGKPREGLEAIGVRARVALFGHGPRRAKVCARPQLRCQPFARRHAHLCFERRADLAVRNGRPDSGEGQVVGREGVGLVAQLCRVLVSPVPREGVNPEVCQHLRAVGRRAFVVVVGDYAPGCEGVDEGWAHGNCHRALVVERELQRGVHVKLDGIEVRDV